MPETSTDKRRSPRVRRKLRVTVDLRGRSFPAVTGNLSGTGLLLHTSGIILPGTAISGGLELNGREVRFSALVRWSRTGARTGSLEVQNTLGVTFMNPPGKAYLDYLAAVIAAGAELEPQTGSFQAVTHTEIGGPKRESSPPRPSVPSTAPTQVPFARLRTASSAGVENTASTAGGGAVVRRTPSQAFAIAPPPPEQFASLPVTRAWPNDEPKTQFHVREEVPTAETRPIPGSRLVPGLNGKAEAATKGNGSRAGTRSPLAPSSAATLVERAATQAVSSALPPGMQSVGLSLSVVLVQPPMVTLGARLEATATLLEVVANRSLRFRAEVREGDRLVATGDHERMLVTAN